MILDPGGVRNQQHFNVSKVEPKPHSDTMFPAGVSALRPLQPGGQPVRSGYRGIRVCCPQGH